MKQRKRAVVVGLGSQSLGDQIPCLLRRDDVELVAVCDPLKSAHDRFCLSLPHLKSLAYFSSFDELLGSCTFDFAVVAVPHNEYGPIVERLCARGIPFMKEKPLARNLPEAHRFLQLPNFERCAFVCAQRRYNPLYKSAKDYLGSLGSIYLFNATYKLNIPNPHEGWRGKTSVAGGGCILDMGYHIIDQLLWWFGTPDSIFAQVSSMAVPNVDYDAEDTATIAFKYSSGLHGSITISRAGGTKQEEYAVYGSAGAMNGNKKYLLVNDRKGVRLFSQTIQNADIPFDAQLDFFLSRIVNGRGFADVQSSHLKNMEFIDRCYAVSSSHKIAHYV